MRVNRSNGCKERLTVGQGIRKSSPGSSAYRPTPPRCPASGRLVAVAAPPHSATCDWTEPPPRSRTVSSSPSASSWPSAKWVRVRHDDCSPVNQSNSSYSRHCCKCGIPTTSGWPCSPQCCVSLMKLKNSTDTRKRCCWSRSILQVACPYILPTTVSKRGGPEALTSTTILKMCGVKTTMAGQELYILKTIGAPLPHIHTYKCTYTYVSYIYIYIYITENLWSPPTTHTHTNRCIYTYVSYI